MTSYETTFKPTKRPLTIAVDEHNTIAYVGWGEPPAGMLGKQVTLLVGFLAELLFRAVAGRNYHEHPDNADWHTAQEARSELKKQSRLARFAKNGKTSEDQLKSVLAQVVAAGYPGFIHPWLGSIKLDKFGFPIMEDAEYHQIIMADTVPTTSIV